MAIWDGFSRFCSSHTAKVLLELVSETVVQVCQSYASHEVVLAGSQKVYMFDVTFSRLEDSNEQRNVNQTILMGGTLFSDY